MCAWQVCVCVLLSLVCVCVPSSLGQDHHLVSEPWPEKDRALRRARRVAGGSQPRPYGMGVKEICPRGNNKVIIYFVIS